MLKRVLMKTSDRYWSVERVRTRSKWQLSDHKPKLMRVGMVKQKWRK